MNKRFYSLEIGKKVVSGDKVYEITHFITSNAVLAREVETGQSERLVIDSLKPFLEENHKKNHKKNHDEERLSRDPQEYTDEDWAIAQRRVKDIGPLLSEEHSTRQLAEETARRVGVGIATLYRWRGEFLQSGHVSSLVPKKRGRKPGTKLLDESREKLLATTIEDFYLTKERNSIVDTVDEVKLRFKNARLKAPHKNTIRKRIKNLPPAMVLNARGYQDEARKYQPIRGKFPGAETPLSVVQIDHALGNVILVEETTRLPIGRPWITLAIDVCSRMVTGLYVSFEHPSALAAGMCVANSLLPKNEYLAEVDVPGTWPVWGKMGILHADNAREFRGKMLKTACQEYGIDPQFRPVKVPHYGGHIERLMGTAALEAIKLPGKTFSSTRERQGYNSDAKAVMTLKEFEQHLVDFIVNIYHQRKHSALDMPPIRKWELGILGDDNNLGIGLPPIPTDPFRVRLNFMPFVERTVQRYGLEIDKIFYYSEILNPFINQISPEDSKRKRKFIVRRDPRDISKVYFYDPDVLEYYVIPYRNPQHPAASLWELKMVRKLLKEQGEMHVDEEKIFEALFRMRKRVDEAKNKSKKARRSLARRPSKKQAGGPAPNTGRNRDPSSGQTAPEVSDDIFDNPVCFDDLRGAQ